MIENSKQLKKWLKKNKHLYKMEYGYDQEKLTKSLAHEFKLGINGMIPDDVYDFVQDELA